MEVLLLAVILMVSLFIIPLGLPGLWVMLAAAVAYSLLVPHSIGMFALIGTAVFAVVAEILEFTLAGKYVRRYGGSKRASWGAILGGMVGAIVGFPAPVIGPIIGSFVGAFAGALVFEFWGNPNPKTATRAATGALIGKAVASAMKVAIGFVIAVWLMTAALV